MSNPWPERETWTLKSYGQLDETIEENKHDYLIRMVQQLFVELAELRTLVAKQSNHGNNLAVHPTSECPSFTEILHALTEHEGAPDGAENPYESDPDLISNRGKP